MSGLAPRRPRRQPEPAFECPFDHDGEGCDCVFSSVGAWARHMRDEHGVEGPL